MTMPERFLAKVEKTDGCWNWVGSRRVAGSYGNFWDGTRNWLAHRWSYETFVGPIPEGLSVDHLCRNKACVNPAHLEPVTHRENVLRGESPIAKQARQTHCKRGHEFTPDNTYATSRGGRACRACAIAAAAAARRRGAA